MGFFNEDPFEDIVREFFGGSGRRVSDNGRKFISGEDEERTIDYVETSDKIFLVFELPGYYEEDIDLEVKLGKLKIVASKKNLNNFPPYMTNKMSKDLKIEKILPVLVKNKKYDSTFKNGILEVSFRK